MAGALREVLARFGISADTRPLDRANRRISSTTRSLRGLVAAAGGAATLVAMRRFVSGAVAMGDELDKTAQQVGLTTAELQAFRHAAELSGVDGAAFANSLGQLQRRALDAAEGTAESADAFTRIGISIDQLTGSNGELVGAAELLRLVADGMQGTENSTVRTATAMELMGRSGRRMLPMLTGGREGLAAMEAELAELGGGASAEFIRQSVQMTDEMTRAKLATTSLRATFLTALLPTMTRVVQWLTRMAAALSETGAAADLAKPILIALGVAATAAAVQIGIAWGATVAPILLAAAAAALLYLAVDDVYGAIEGRESVLEEFVNSLGYLIDMPRLGTNSLQGLRDTWEQYFAVVAAGTPPMEALGYVLQSMWASAENGTGLGVAVSGVILVWVAAIQQLTTTLVDAYSAFTAFYGVAASASSGTGFDFGSRVRSQVQNAGGSFLRSIPGLGGAADRIFGSREDVDASGAAQARARAEDARVRGISGNYATAPQPPRNVQITKGPTSIVVNAAEDPQATARIVRAELERSEAAKNRESLAALEPAPAGGS